MYVFYVFPIRDMQISFLSITRSVSVQLLVSIANNICHRDLDLIFALKRSRRIPIDDSMHSSLYLLLSF